MHKLLAAYFISMVCAWTLGFLIPLYVLEASHSALWTSLAYGAAMAPYILVTPFAGVWSDRYSKKNFLIGGDALSIGVAAVLYAVVTQRGGNVAVTTLIGMEFLLASIAATHHPVFQAFAPDLLAARELKTFNSLVSAIDNMVRIMAPVAVAAMMGFVSKDTVLLVCGVGYCVSIPVLATLPARLPQSRGRTGVLHELKAGVKFVCADANLVSFSVLFFCVNFGLTIINANLIYIYATLFAVAQQGMGYYFAIIGAGAVSGSLLAPRVIDRVDDAAIIIYCCVAAGVLAVLACFAASPLALSIIWALSTACQSVVVVTFFTFRQKVVPKDMLGRTVGVTRLISYLAIPPASVLGGMLMDTFHSETSIMATGGIAILAGAAIALRAPAFKGLLARRAWTK